jgi:hypothetical protein
VKEMREVRIVEDLGKGLFKEDLAQKKGDALKHGKDRNEKELHDRESAKRNGE